MKVKNQNYDQYDGKEYHIYLFFSHETMPICSGSSQLLTQSEGLGWKDVYDAVRSDHKITSRLVCITEVHTR